MARPAAERSLCRPESEVTKGLELRRPTSKAYSIWAAGPEREREGGS